MSVLMLGALGVVFGDIGTSPLYALRECFASPSHPVVLTDPNILGILSIIFWVLILVISIEYVLFILRADNRGEGGILALMALVSRKSKGKTQLRPVFAMIGLIGAALLFADAMITPAISVLSAVEGLQMETTLFQPYIVPLAISILVALYTFQRFGTARIGAVFGPIMLLWFTVLGVVGVVSIAQTPGVLRALNPLYAVQFFIDNGHMAFRVIGSVFLVVTGGEALYADMGHFGRSPIQRAWFLVVLPGLALNYFGQGALLMRMPEALPQLFFTTVPKWSLLPMVALAMMATVIASQAVISGAFSVANSAVQLGYIPRIDIRQTSESSMGQIYVPILNWLFMIGTTALVVGFKESSRLAAAYGVAVSTTMLATTLFLFFVARRVWHWPRPAALMLAIPFLCIDSTFFTSNLLKIPAGGWLPLTVGVILYALMDTWKKGRTVLQEALAAENMSLDLFLESLALDGPVRVPGGAVFLTPHKFGVPRALLHNLKHNKVLHESVLLLTVETLRVPYVADAERLAVEDLGQGMVRASLTFGFLEQPDLTRELAHMDSPYFRYDPMTTTFFLGRETVLVGHGPSTLWRWRRQLFALMTRNALSAANFFRLPANRVVEIGSQIEI